MPDNLCAASPEEQKNRYNLNGEPDTSTVYWRPNCGINCMVKDGDMIKAEEKILKNKRQKRQKGQKRQKLQSTSFASAQHSGRDEFPPLWEIISYNA